MSAQFQKGREAWNRFGSDFPYYHPGRGGTLCVNGRACDEPVLALRARQN